MWYLIHTWLTLRLERNVHARTWNKHMFKSIIICPAIASGRKQPSIFNLLLHKANSQVKSSALRRVGVCMRGKLNANAKKFHRTYSLRNTNSNSSRDMRRPFPFCKTEWENGIAKTMRSGWVFQEIHTIQETVCVWESKLMYKRMKSSPELAEW